MLITVINFATRTIFINMADLVGFKTESEKADFIKNTIFLSSFFNSAISMLLASWSGREISIPLLGSFFEGVYSDFNSDWFPDVGYVIIYNCLYNLVWPFIEFFVFYGIRHLKRCIDQRSIWPSNVFSTKCYTIQGFEDKYNGPAFLVHWKYSNIMKIVIMSFFYGSILPILFPIALFQIFYFYAVERLMVYYSYMKPPTYDDLLTRRTIETLTYAPIFFLLIGAIAFSNQQVFMNYVPKLDPEEVYPLSHHTFN
jgi:hypothetical protein